MEAPHLFVQDVDFVQSRASIPGRRFHSGDRVQVAQGVWAGVEGMVRERRAPGRVIVSLHLFQAGVSLEIDERFLALLS